MADFHLAVDGPAAPPRKNGELIFEAPWESRAFGLVVTLQERGVLSWTEFRECLIAEIDAWERTADEQPWSYYVCWLAALERVLVAKGLCRGGEIDDRTVQFRARPAGHDHEH